MSESAMSKYTELRGRLAHRGFTLRRWARRERLPVGSVYNAVKALRNGPDAVRIRNRLEKFLNEK